MTSNTKSNPSHINATTQVRSIDWMTYLFVIICLIMVLFVGINLWGGM